MATATTTIPAGAAPAADAIPMRRIFAFLAMVFGMFMAILDIQIVSASLAEIQAGLLVDGIHVFFARPLEGGISCDNALIQSIADQKSALEVIPDQGYIHRTSGFNHASKFIQISRRQLWGFYEMVRNITSQ